MKSRLEMLVELFKSAYQLNQDMGKANPNDTDYDRGVKNGFLAANKLYEGRIKRLEQLVSEMDSYMIEDVQLDGMGSEEIA